jgi:FixJ family two-component response regulator
MTSAASAIVLIIDDDARMRAATERLLKTVGLHFESFATPEDFLQGKLPDAPVALCWMYGFLE